MAGVLLLMKVIAMATLVYVVGYIVVVVTVVKKDVHFFDVYHII